MNPRLMLYPLRAPTPSTPCPPAWGWAPTGRLLTLELTTNSYSSVCFPPGKWRRVRPEVRLCAADKSDGKKSRCVAKPESNPKKLPHFPLSGSRSGFSGQSSRKRIFHFFQKKFRALSTPFQSAFLRSRPERTSINFFSVRPFFEKRKKWRPTRGETKAPRKRHRSDTRGRRMKLKSETEGRMSMDSRKHVLAMPRSGRPCKKIILLINTINKTPNTP
jgi:hypothetical protein